MKTIYLKRALLFDILLIVLVSYFLFVDSDVRLSPGDSFSMQNGLLFAVLGLLVLVLFVIGFVLYFITHSDSILDN